MVSRRKILSRSRDDLNAEQQYVPADEEDVWYQKDKLFKVSLRFLFFSSVLAQQQAHNTVKSI